MRATGALGKRFDDPWFNASVLNCTSNLDVIKIIFSRKRRKIKCTIHIFPIIFKEHLIKFNQ